MNSHFFVSLYRLNISALLQHLKIFQLFFSKKLPQLFNHFNAIGISTEQYLVCYFITKPDIFASWNG